MQLVETLAYRVGAPAERMVSKVPKMPKIPEGAEPALGTAIGGTMAEFQVGHLRWSRGSRGEYERRFVAGRSDDDDIL